MKKFKIAIICLTSVGVCFLFGAFVKYIPGLVSYKEKENITPAVEALNEQRTSEKVPQYKKIEQITQDAPFVITNDEQDIFVYKDGTKLYRIKASLHDFPDGDVRAIGEGIVIETKMQLFEFVSYLES